MPVPKTASRISRRLAPGVRAEEGLCGIERGKFHEAVTNEILDDLVRATNARFMRLTAEILVRGGIYTTVVAEHGKP